MREHDRTDDGLIFQNGSILTMDIQSPEATAIYVENGRIAEVRTDPGGGRALRENYPQARSVDLAGRTLLPGFIDGHSHLTATAMQLLMVNCAPPPRGVCGSMEELIRHCQKELRQKKLRPGQWLLGMGYDPSAYEEERHPRREELDRISDQVPVCLTHTSGHMCVCNSPALRILGREDSNGLLVEQEYLNPEVQRKINGFTEEEILEAVGQAARLYAARGFTTIQEARAGEREYALLAGADSLGYLPVDVTAYLTVDAASRYLPGAESENGGFKSSQKSETGSRSGRLRPGGCKIFLDGSPQGKTAWLSQSYYRPPQDKDASWSGQPAMTREETLKAAVLSIAKGWQLNAHVNGDAAIDQLICCYAKALCLEAGESYEILAETQKAEAEETWAFARLAKKALDRGLCPDLRPVAIHCQTARQDQIRQMACLGMIPSFFVDHVYYWGDYYRESVLGPERAANISPAAWAAAEGIPFTLHQDAPVVEADPLFAIHNAVNRRTKSGYLLGAGQRISVEEALRAVTIYGAWQLKEEKQKGSITAGKLADLVILDGNPLTVPPQKLKDIQVLATFKEGKCVSC